MHYLCTLPDLVKYHLRPLGQRPLQDKTGSDWGDIISYSFI